MQIYISTSSIKSTSMQKGISIFDLPEFAGKNGFNGLEISDREIRSSDNNLLQRLSSKSSQHNCGLILDVNADLTYSNKNFRIQEVNHVNQMIDFANKLNLGLMRICGAGQFISIQKFISNCERLGVLDNPLTLTYKSNIQSKVFNNAYITRLANYIRKNTTSKLIYLKRKKARVAEALRMIVKDIERYNIKKGKS